MNIANQRLFILYTSQQKALNAIGCEIFKFFFGQIRFLSIAWKQRKDNIYSYRIPHVHKKIVIESPMV